MFSWFRRRPKDKLQRFYASLPAIKAGRGTYTRGDRYRDFRAVFYGHSSPEQGRRVLAQILDEANGLPDLESDTDQALRFRAGKRSIGLKIVKWLNAEPPQEEEDVES